MIVDQAVANAQIARLAAWRPVGSTVEYQGAQWIVVQHREVGQFGPWGSLGAIPVLQLESVRDRSLRLSVPFDEAEALMRQQP